VRKGICYLVLKTVNIYLDIDGVLITKKGKPANGLFEFLEYVTGNYTCYWLTTHCRDGTPERAVEYVNKIGGIDKELLEKIKPCKPWATFKTEAIDFSEPFIWLDDNLFEGERRALNERGMLQNMEYFDLVHDPNQLVKIMAEMKRKS